MPKKKTEETNINHWQEDDNSTPYIEKKKVPPVLPKKKSETNCEEEPTNNQLSTKELPVAKTRSSPRPSIGVDPSTIPKYYETLYKGQEMVKEPKRASQATDKMNNPPTFATKAVKAPDKEKIINQRKTSKEKEIQDSESEVTEKFVRTPAPITDLLEFAVIPDNLNSNSPKCERFNMGFNQNNVNTPSMMKEAQLFLEKYFEHRGLFGTDLHRQRLHQVLVSIAQNNTYDHTREELIFGVKDAFKNAATCLGRYVGRSLQIFDCRHLNDCHSIFRACCNHIKYATNNGKIRSAITIFRPTGPNGQQYRIWNKKLIQFAGYKTLNGTITGDPCTVYLTKLCRKLGWKSKYTNWDVLPLLIQLDYNDPQMFEIPSKLIKIIALRHPKYQMETLNLRWFALPTTSNIGITIGGIQYSAAPFNGIHLASSLARGPFNEESRYNYSAEVGKLMELDVTAPPSHWRKSAIETLQEAVLFSFQLEGTFVLTDEKAAIMLEKFVDEQTKAKNKQIYLDLKTTAGEAIQGCLSEKDYAKFAPDENYQPSFKVLEEVERKYVWSKFRLKANEQRRLLLNWRHHGHLKSISLCIRFFVRMIGHITRRRFNSVTIIYTRLHGVSQHYATLVKYSLQEYFKTQLVYAPQYNPSDMEFEDVVLLIAEAPSNFDWIYNFEVVRSQKLRSLRFACLALDTSASPDFGATARHLSTILESGGAQSIIPLTEANEVTGQNAEFLKWLKATVAVLVKIFGHSDIVDFPLSIAKTQDNSSWKFVVERGQKLSKTAEDLCADLGKIHRQEVMPLRIIKNEIIYCEDFSHKRLLTDFVTVAGKVPDFRPGDDLGIFPQNHPLSVNLILSRLMKGAPDRNEVIVLSKRKSIDTSYGTKKFWVWPSHIPPRVTLREALTFFLDITSPPSQEILAEFVSTTTDLREKKLLNALATDAQTYARWCFRKAVTLAELLLTFTHLYIDYKTLLQRFPPLMPRLYTIASSPYENKVRIVTNVFKEREGNREGAYSVCSSWMASHTANCFVYAFIQPQESFHLPSDASIPVLMIGAGVSIAPFRSFWNERIKLRQLSPRAPEEDTMWGSWGKLVLYMGCRSRDRGEIMFDDEIETVIDKNHIIGKFAYSRERNMKRTYVQDLLKADARHIYQDLMMKSGHLYLCGDRKVITKSMQEITDIFMMEGNMSKGIALKYIHRLMIQRRIHVKSFGVTLHRDELIEEEFANLAAIAKT